MKNILFSMVLILFAIHTYAQNCSHCDIALLSGARDEFESKMNSSYAEATNKLFSHDYTYWSNYQQSGNKSIAGDAAYSIFSASFGSSSGSNESKQKFEDFRKNYENNKTLSQEEQKYISSKTASETAYKAWTACISDCSKRGIFLEKEGNNNDEFIVSLKWIPENGGMTTAKVTAVQFINCTRLRGDLTEQAELKPFSTLLATYRRTDRNADVSISVSVENLGSKTITIYKNENLEARPQLVLPPAVPAGTVVAFAGNKIPPGWLLCDGAVKNQKDYPVLYNALGTSWGSGDATAGSFNLPDMRGMFLRGVDGTANNDPDHNTRVSVALNGGNEGNKVGSFQSDTLKRHRHEYNNSYAGEKAHLGGDGGRPGSNPDQKTEPFGGKETRPKNVYVFYIIKE